WAHERGCKWNANVTFAAVEKNHFDVLEWTLANGCELHPQAAFAGLWGSGDRRIIDWALQQQIVEFEWVPEVPRLTLEVLRYLKKERPSLADEFPQLKCIATRQLARVGDMTGLEWARANGYFEA